MLRMTKMMMMNAKKSDKMNPIFEGCFSYYSNGEGHVSPDVIPYGAKEMRQWMS